VAIVRTVIPRLAYELAEILVSAVQYSIRTLETPPPAEILPDLLLASHLDSRLDPRRNRQLEVLPKIELRSDNRTFRGLVEPQQQVVPVGIEIERIPAIGER
jgi:hypothetical protein